MTARDKIAGQGKQTASADAVGKLKSTELTDGELEKVSGGTDNAGATDDHRARRVVPQT